MRDLRGASQDAFGSHDRAGLDHDVLWLQPRDPRSVRLKQPRRHSRKPLLRLTTTLGFGALVTISTAQSAVAPASHRAMEMAAPAAVSAALSENAVAIIWSALPQGGFNAQSYDLKAPLSDPQIGAGDTDFTEFRANNAARLSDPNEILQFGKMRIRRELVETIVRAADVAGVDPAYMMALADKESSFIPNNKAATSSAQGLFQFIERTWLEVIREFGPKYGMHFAASLIDTTDEAPVVTDPSLREWVLGLRRNPYLSAVMAAEMLKRDKAKIEERIGRELKPAEFYLSHFLGPQSATKLLELVTEKPRQSAPRVFPQAARANRTLFFARGKRKARHLTVAEVKGKLENMIDARIGRYESVTAYAPVDTASAVQ